MEIHELREDFNKFNGGFKCHMGKMVLICKLFTAGPSERGSAKFEKRKVKKRSFHSFSRSAKWKKYAFTLFREVQSEKNMLSLFFEKCKVKKNAFTLFREVKSEIKMLRDRDREVKILENSWQFSRNEILQQNYSTRRRRWSTSKMTSPTWR